MLLANLHIQFFELHTIQMTLKSTNANMAKKEREKNNMEEENTSTRRFSNATKAFISFWDECMALPGKDAILVYIKKLVFYTRVESLELNSRFLESIKDINENFDGYSYKIDISNIPEEYHTATVFIIINE